MRILAVVLAAALLVGSGLAQEGREPSARKLVAQLTDGNEHRIANNRIVERLVAKGPSALVPLRQALEDEEFEGRGYAAWAIGEVLRATGERPPQMLEALRDAAAGRSEYVRTLAKSALKVLGEKETAKEWKPNPYIVAALRDAPKPGTDPAKMVAALPERKGHWRDIIGDRLILAGKASLPALKAAVEDESFGARVEAARTLSRLTAALNAKTATPGELIAQFRDGRNVAVAANNMIVDRLLLHGKAAIPALVAEIGKPRAEQRDYASWALAVILRATGERPKEAMKILTDRYDPGASPISILGK